MRLLRVWLAVLGLAPLCACAQSMALAEPQTAIAPPAAVEYRLGTADRIRVIVFGEAALSGEFVVSGSGRIAFPLVGDVQVTGLTGREVADSLETELRDGFIREPRVSVEVLNFRPFYILGEVSAPGEYPYTNGLTVLNAVATAKGFTYRADQRRVYIKRSAESAERAVPLTSTTLVNPGDTIRIGERFF